MPSLLVIRIRGQPDVRYDIRETLRRFRLFKKFHATIVRDTPEILGMLKKVENYVAYGPVSPEVIKELLLKRGRLIGNKPLTEEYVREKLGMSIDELAEKIYSGEISLKDIPGLKPVFRLHPPRGGFKKSTKLHVKMGGELGRRDDIEKLVVKMV